MRESIKVGLFNYSLSWAETLKNSDDAFDRSSFLPEELLF